MTIYIYRVEKTYPARNHVYRSKSIKNSNYSRIPPRLVRPVRPTGQTGRAPAGSATTPDWSDRLVRPVDANFGCQHLQHGINARFPKRDQFSVKTSYHQPSRRVPPAPRPEPALTDGAEPPWPTQQFLLTLQNIS